jgi:hypothetical protein
MKLSQPNESDVSLTYTPIPIEWQDKDPHYTHVFYILNYSLYSEINSTTSLNSLRQAY